MERPKAAAHQSWLGLAGLAWSWKLWCQMLKKKKKEVKLKAHDERLLEPSKGEKKRKKRKRLWQHDSWFIDFPAQFFSSRGASKEQSNLWVCWRLLYSLGKWTLANTHSSTDTRRTLAAHKHTLENKHTALPVGAEFLILKYTAINQTLLPRAPARLSQWKAQASGTLIAIYRAGHARRGASTERPFIL